MVILGDLLKILKAGYLEIRNELGELLASSQEYREVADILNYEVTEIGHDGYCFNIKVRVR